MFLVYVTYFKWQAHGNVFSSRLFKQRPTNSSEPLCFGRKARRSLSVKFESVLLDRESQGQPAAVRKGQHTALSKST